MSDTNNIISEEDREKFKLLIDQIVDGMKRKETEDQQIKETINQMKAEFTLSPKVIRAIAKAKAKGDFEKVRSEMTEILDWYETAIEG